MLLRENLIEGLPWHVTENRPGTRRRLGHQAFTQGRIFQLPQSTGAVRQLHNSAKEFDRRADDKIFVLRDARNTAAHGGGDKRITPGEALDFAEQATKLDNTLAFAL